MKSIFVTRQNRNRHLSVLAPLFFLTACGSLQPSDSISSPAGNTREQIQADTLACEDQSKKQAGLASQKALDTFFAVSLLGKLVESQFEDSKQREFFSKCMTARGYKVSPPKNG